MKRLVLLALALLAACGTPQERCIAANTRELRTVDRLIAETEGNLERGYAYETVTISESYWDYCQQPQIPGQPPVPPRLCLKERDFTKRQPKAIDLEAEARVLAGLQAKRVELARLAEDVIAQCKAEYPE